jgi:hypothetical protein
MPAGVDPAGDARRLRLGSFLLTQTRRTLRDHWYDENPGAEPYYRVAGRLFLGDARAQAPPGKRDRWSAAFTQAVGESSKKLEAPGDWMLVETTEQATDAAGRLIPDRAKIGVITSEQQMQREYRLVPASKDDRPPSGFASLWAADSSDLRSVEPAAFDRLAVAVNPDAEALEKAPVFALRLASPLVEQAEIKGFPRPFVQRAPLQVRGLHRGQVIKLDAPVDLHPEPSTVIRQFPLPEKASVAVRTDKYVTSRVGTNDSGIVFVLDCSGSMRPPAGGDPKRGRYFQALQALRTVLTRVPKDTTVSVLTFGRLTVNAAADKPERTIEHALQPTRWNPQDPRQLADLMAILESFEPWNQSPLARSLLFAREDLKGVKGSKTIIAITDGHDNRFNQDPELEPRYKTVPALLKAAFDNGDTALHVVVFPTSDVEEKKSIEQFKEIETFKPAGRVHSIRDTVKLAEVLDVVMRQRLNYWIDRVGRNVSVNDVPESGLDVSTSDKNDRWYGKGLPPGGNKVRVYVPERIEKDVLLHRGDLLLLDLVDSPKGMQFERYLFSDDYAWKRRLESKAKDWRLSVLQNQQLDSGGLQMLLGLEKTVDRRETILEQIKPREAWIELTAPQEVSEEISVRWSGLIGYPAPAWSIDVPAWPVYAKTTTAARPVLDIWWNPDEAARAGADLPLAEMLDARQRHVVMKGEVGVVLESAVWEKHRVRVERGIFDWRNCLVVRMRHDRDRPIIIRLDGIQPAGSEHRLYAKANKMTALYWFPEEKTGLGDVRLRVISVNAFKDAAVQRGYHLRVGDLASPEPTDFRPRAPIELK